MDIIGMATKAADLFDEGLKLYNQLKPSIESGVSGFKDESVQEALARLEASMKRAKAAGDSLEAAIADKLGE